MSAFEYVSVLASVIIGLALVDILVSLNRLIRAAGLVRWHWAAPAAALLVVGAVETLADGESLAGVLDNRLVDVVVFGVFVSLVFIRRLWWHAIAILLLYSGPLGWLSRSLV